MPRLINIFRLPLILWMCFGGILLGQENSEEVEEPELPLEEAMAALDIIAPLPSENAEGVGEPFNLILDELEQPDYAYLRELQVQERLADKEAAKVAQRNRIEKDYFTITQTGSHIIDPQGLLASNELNLIKDKLADYSRKNYPPIVVSIMPRDDHHFILTTPSEKFSSIIAENPQTILIYYFDQHPNRPKVYIGKSLYEVLPYTAQRDFKAAALLRAQDKEGVFHASYDHLSSLTNNLSEHFEKHLPRTIKPTPQIAEPLPAHNSSESGSIESAAPAKNTFLATLLVIAICLIALGVTFALAKFISRLSKKPPSYRYQTREHPETLDFPVAKDTSQPISFKDDPAP